MQRGQCKFGVFWGTYVGYLGNCVVIPEIIGLCESWQGGPYVDGVYGLHRSRFLSCRHGGDKQKCAKA